MTTLGFVLTLLTVGIIGLLFLTKGKEDDTIV